VAINDDRKSCPSYNDIIICPDVTQTSGKAKKRYRLEPKSLARLKAIVQARKAPGQRQFGGRLFGCPEPQNPIDESADGDN
jgi:hypothetical protein